MRLQSGFGIIRLLSAMTLFMGCSALNEQQASEPIGTNVASIPVETQTTASSNQDSGNGLTEPTPSVSSIPELPTKRSPLPVEIQSESAEFPTIQVDHIVVVVEENHSYKQIVGSEKAPYINSLINEGALFTNAHAIAHPSQPNYLALFSGSTQGVKDDSCGKPFQTDNLADELNKVDLTFTGYSEDLPKAGFTGCWSDGYGRKHNPWVQFSNVSAELNRPFTDFPADYTKLPTVSFVIPSHQNDMHDGTITEADEWLKAHMSSYVNWAKGHHSLFLLIWDEDDNSKGNQIPVIMVGPMIKPGEYSEKIDHYTILRTIEDLYGLSLLGATSESAPIESLWK